MFTKKWTGDLVGLMHDNKVSHSDLAAQLGVCREYVSLVLNGHRNPPDAEERFFKAFWKIMDTRKSQNVSSEERTK